MRKSPPKKRLKTRGLAFWKIVTDEFTLTDGDCELLLVACELLDRAQQCRELLEKDGLTIVDRFNQTKSHPALEGERQSLLAFIKVRRELGLDVAPEESRGPLPRGYS